MDKIIIMNNARKEKLLNKIVRTNNKTDTWKNHIINKTFIKSEEGEVNAIIFNRTKFNKMDNNKEQDNYTKRCNEKKKEYRLYKTEEIFITVPYFVYEFFEEYKEKLDIDTNPDNYLGDLELTNLLNGWTK